MLSNRALPPPLLCVLALQRVVLVVCRAFMSSLIRVLAASNLPFRHILGHWSAFPRKGPLGEESTDSSGLRPRRFCASYK